MVELSTPTFPPEIVSRILLYVGSPYLKDWCHLNSTFLRCYLEDKYRTVRLDLFSSDSLKHSAQIRSLDVSAFVRTLEVQCPNWLKPGSDEKIKDFEEITTFITRLTELRYIGPTSPDLHPDAPRPNPSDMPLELQFAAKIFPRQIIAASARTLTRVFVELSWMWISQIGNLFHNDCRLTHLGVRTFRANTPRWDRDFSVPDAYFVNGGLNVLETFIKKHANTLQELDLAFKAAQGNFDRFYTGLSGLELPYLKALRLTAPFTAETVNDEGAAVTHLLRLYGPQLNSLALLVSNAPRGYNTENLANSLYTPIMSSLFAHGNGYLPRLHELHLMIDGLAPRDDALSVLPSTLHAARDTLTDLQVSGKYLKGDELSNILDILDESLEKGGAQLTRFAVRVSELSPEIVDLLAHRLPELEVLDINIASIADVQVTKTPPKTPSPAGEGGRIYPSFDFLRSPRMRAFVNAMAEREYPNWRLSKLNVDEAGPGGWCGTGYESLSSDVDAAIVGATPRLKEIREKSYLAKIRAQRDRKVSMHRASERADSDSESSRFSSPILLDLLDFTSQPPTIEPQLEVEHAQPTAMQIPDGWVPTVDDLGYVHVPPPLTI